MSTIFKETEQEYSDFHIELSENIKKFGFVNLISLFYLKNPLLFG